MELWDAYNRDGERTGEKLVRGEPIPEGRYHLVCDILVRHRDGSFLLMQRDPRKPVYPGCWEASAGGSALIGEDPIDCAKRELSEETGITDGAFREIGFEIADKVQTIYHAFVCITDVPKEAIRLQDGETVAYRWLTLPEMRAFIDSGEMIAHQRRRMAAYFHDIFQGCM